MRNLLLVGALALIGSTSLYAGEIDFVEDFALARDRAAILKQLVPGTEDFYYYHALHFLQTEQFEKIDGHLTAWVQRHGETQRVTEIRTRHAFAIYDKNPQRTLEFLRARLGLNFPHQREELNAEPNFPTALDANSISRDAYINRANALTQDDTNRFEDSALDWLVTFELNPNHRRSLLSRLQRPDYPNLVKIIVEDLNHENSGGFGSHAIHRQLLLTQLEELLKAKPELLNQQNFVVAYLTKLQPNPDADLRNDPALLETYLDRLIAFTNRLMPVHNSLKAHLLYHRLVLDRQRGIYNKARFLEYLKLPRRVGYLSAKMANSDDLRHFPVDLNADYSGATLLGPVVNDEPLVRSYLAHFLLDAADGKEFEPYINDVYLRHLFAEVKILNGLGNEEQWASLLPPALFQQLKERVDLDFAFTNKTHFGPEESVKLDLFVKNSGTLIVKVFEINTKNYYREHLREVETDINLDGLVANVEQTHPMAATPLRRVAKRFEFPQLDRPGVYVIDFIGNGRSSRALIRKGRLRQIVRTTPVGQLFTVLNEKNEVVADATIWIAGHEYTAVKLKKDTGETPAKESPAATTEKSAAESPAAKDPTPEKADDKVVTPQPAKPGESGLRIEGSILVPFTTNPTQQPIVISHGGLSSLDTFQHEAETPSLHVGFHVDRESLLNRKTAKLLVRAGLNVNGTPVSIKRLEQVKLTIQSTDLDGIVSTQELPNFILFEDRESIHEFQVPSRLAAMTFKLTAKVKKLSAGGQEVDLASSDSVTLNGIDRTEKTETLHLAKNADGYVVELRGKTGEAKPSRPVQLAFKHRDFRDLHHVTLKTDPAGRIKLGSLTDIVIVSATNPQQTSHTWILRPDRHTYSQSVHGRVGESITLPFLPLSAGLNQGNEAKPVDQPNDDKQADSQQAKLSTTVLRSELSLLELRSDVYVADRFEHLSLQDGLLVLQKLPVGDYNLLLKSSNHRIRIRITAGPKLNNVVLGASRQLETPRLAPVQIDSVKPIDGGFRVQLQNASKFTRLHVFATRYLPEYDSFDHLSRVRGAEPYQYRQSPAQSIYLTGRNIGDEYRYIIDRKYATKFPGNTLDRPALLLNPWAVRTTQTGVQGAQAGGDFAKMQSNARTDAARDAAPEPAAAPPTGNFANLDFLADASAVLVNLTPNEQGVIEITSKALGAHQHIHLVAIDPLNTTYRSLALPEPEANILDLRLLAGLDPQGHYTQQKQITQLAAGQAFTLLDITTSKFEAYDSLTRVYSLYSTLNPDPTLIEFAFILNWPNLKPEEKRTLYSKHASHELSFFLSRKDPEFFEAVIKPYLANKQHQTFLDHYLLGHDLAEFVLPWNYAQLNIAERVLLGQRLKAEQPHTARSIAEQYALLPPNMDRFIHLFDTAVRRSALDVEDGLGLKSNLGDLDAKQAKKLAVPQLLLAEERLRKAAEMAPAMAGKPAVRPMRANEAKSDADEAKDKASDKLAEKMSARDGKSSKEVANRFARRKLDELKRVEDMPKQEEEALFESNFSDLELARVLYRELGPTMEWAENNYHHLTIQAQDANLIGVNAFWKDLAEHDPAKPFVSRNFAEASRNFPEMLLALAVLDLPFEAPKHETKFDGVKMSLNPGGPAVVFHEEIKPSPAADGAAKVLVSQNFFRHGDRTRLEAGEQIDKFVSDEFLVQVVYGCQIVLTNPTSSQQKLNVLLQIPRGSIPVLNSQLTKTVHLNLQPYHTQTLEYHFYFPLAGKFPHFPVHVAKNEVLIAAPESVTFNVVNQPTKIDTESWDYVSQFGTTEAVLQFLDQHNVSNINLERIAWRMHDVKVFEAVIAKLAQRHVYVNTLWSYALKHNQVAAAREYLQHVDRVINDCGGQLVSTLLTIDPIKRRSYEFLEYKPLVNARAHSLGKRRQIVNDRFHLQYHQTLKQLSYVRQLDDDDLLTVTYYLLLQDRIEEALATFSRVTADKVATKMQYDYCAAYLDFFTDDHQLARAIANRYVDHPVDRWRQTFAAIVAQLDEAEGRDAKPINQEDRNQQQTVLAATEPSFDVSVEAKQVKVDYQNLKTVRVNFYEMDVELLFSRNPFVQQFQGQFSSIRPNHSIEVPLQAQEAVAAIEGEANAQLKPGSKLIPLPPALLNKNVLVEVVGAGLTKSHAYYSHALSVQVIENYGQIKVTHQTTGKPVTKAYVKVYAQMGDGQVKFYKDGYTDIRGRFDYSSLSTSDLNQAQKFSILILSDEHGALVREATPPKR